MKNININEGYKELTINGDKRRVIRFNPTDMGIVVRINEAVKKMADETSKDIELKPDGSSVLVEMAEAVEKVNNVIKEQIDYIFDSPVSEVVFKNQSPLSCVGGVPFYERFMDAVLPVIYEEVEREKKASIDRINMYVSQVKKP